MTDVKNKQPEKHSLTGLVWIISIIALILSATSIYFSQKAERIAIKQQSKSASTTSQIQQEIKSLALIQKKTADRSQFLQEKLQKVAKANNLEKNNWQLLKAKHLLELASLNLEWDNEVRSTTFLLLNADKLLAWPLAIDTRAVRKQINQTYLSLKALPVLDNIGLLNKMDAITMQLKNLSMRHEPVKEKAPESNTTNQPNWRKTFDESLTKLSKLVVVRYHKDKESPLISLHQKTLVIRQITFSIENAKWALIHNKQPLFKYSLKHAIIQIEDSFNPDEIATKSIVSELNKLSELSIKLNTISLKPILQSIDKLIAGEQE